MIDRRRFVGFVAAAALLPPASARAQRRPMAPIPPRDLMEAAERARVDMLRAVNEYRASLERVLAFYEAGLNRRDFEAASRHFGARYVQHNPLIADGLAGSQAFLRDLRIIVVSGSGDSKDIQRAAALGADRVVVKPASEELLLEEIGRLNGDRSAAPAV